MKKLVLLLAMLLVFLAGRAAGVRYALDSSVIWQEENRILIALDGNLYEHLVD